MRLLAVECCGPLAQLCSKDDVMTHILPVVQKFSQASRHRIPVAASLTNNSLHLTDCNKVKTPYLWPAMYLKQDKSWRVRYNVAQQLTTLCEALGPDLAKYISFALRSDAPALASHVQTWNAARG